MKKLGFGKKKDDGGDAGRDALFGGKKAKGSNNANPYAVDAGANDPYMKQSNNAPPPYNGGGGGGGGGGPGMDRFRSDKSPTPAGGYGGAAPGPPSDRFGPPPGGDRFGPPSGGDRFGPPSGGDRGGPPPGGDRFAPGNYGASGGFGQRPFGDPAPPSNTGSRYGTGGYGGFGGANAAAGGQDGGAGRDQLFAGAKATPDPVAGMGPPGGAPGGAPGGYGTPANDWESGRGAGYGAPGGYGAYDDRELTQEEQEEEEITATKQEIRFIKQQDVSSTRNALRIAAQAEETGRQTLERLGAQGESIHNTERNLDLASNQNQLAAEKARELKTLNRSMFAVHVSNPFTSARRTREREDHVLDKARKDREQRDATRAEAWGTTSRQQEYSRELNKMGGGPVKSKATLADRAKYQFEADSEDEQMEEEIDHNLDMLHGAAKRLNHVAGAMGREVDIQNKHLDRIGGQVDRVDDEIAVNRSRLDRIK